MDLKFKNSKDLHPVIDILLMLLTLLLKRFVFISKTFSILKLLKDTSNCEEPAIRNDSNFVEFCKYSRFSKLLLHTKLVNLVQLDNKL